MKNLKLNCVLEVVFSNMLKIVRIMKLTTFLLMISALSVLAGESYSQSKKLNLDLKDVTVEDVLSSIESQSEFYFLYSEKIIDVDRKVSLNIKDKNVQDVLNELFAGTDVAYTIKDRIIVLSTPEVLDNISKTVWQQATVRGTVTDKNGQPLPGVTVVVKGTTQGTVTDSDGNYSLTNVSTDATLQFSFVGMRAQEIPVVGKTTIDVAMTEETVGIEEVVAVGYGVQKKGNLTGAVAVIENDALEDRPAAKTTDLLQGVSSGLQITRSNTGNIRGSQNQISIRGVTSRSNPGVLIIVDGIAQESTDASALDNINPNDIESISILKDSQAAIYGARAAGGVILITTKSGKTNKPTINASVIETIQKPSLMREPTNILQLYEMQYEGYVNDGQLTNQFSDLEKFFADNNITFDEIKQNNKKYLLREPYGNQHSYYLGHYDWNNIMFDPSLQQNYNVSISGKTDKVNYYESINYINQDGMLAYGKNYKKRLLITLKNDYNVTSFLKITSNFYLGNEKIIEPYNFSRSTSSIEHYLYRTMPVVAPYTDGGHYANIGGFYNPIGLAKDAGNTTDLSYILHGKLGAEITPFKNFIITAEIATNYDITETDWADIGFMMYDAVDETPQISNNGINRAGAEFSRNRHMVGNLFSQYSYDKLENQMFKLMVGYSHEENDYRDFSAYRRYGLISAELPTMIMGDPNEQYNSEVKNDYSLKSVFARLDYNYKSRYLLEGIFRYDGSSKFAPGHKWSPFYGVSGGWIVSEESFWSSLENIFDYLKIRASWGQLGNQTGIGLYDYISTINIGSAYPFGSWNSPSKNQVATLGTMPSTTRTWEVIESKNIGIDYRFLNSKITGSFDYYVKDNKNMFFNQEFPQVLGTTPPNINGAHLRTKGFEWEIGWNDKFNSGSYYVRLNLANNSNKVIDLADAIIPKQGTNVFVQGYPTDSYFGLLFDGFIKTDAELEEYNSKFTSGIPNNLILGDARFKDLNGDGKLTSLPYETDDNGNPTANSGDLVQFGEGGQHYLYGINMGLNWKNFDFGCFFQGVMKWQVISTVIPNLAWHSPNESYFYHQTWAPDRPDVKWPRLSQDSNIKNYDNQYSDAPYKMYNNRYIRLKNIQLGYTLPSKVTQRINIEKLRVYFNGTDIWELDTLPGNEDPETPFTLRRSPFPRLYSFGANFTF